ncbi:Protein of unknown function [Pyronema omphalodes CBS 100304]|uniref:Uncharacterized protein n=1 Tax=Pyronema omphalodes (strain CBS 100304) TaxID=1076935 RepID=U4LMV8_PYROM|nr:Protein of unknown function [Pyronema omphalodes CBS 100304]
MRREDEGCENIRIAQIDLTGSNFADDLERPAFKGENVNLYNLEKLIQDVGATISESIRQRCKHEWLFVGRIPKETIHNVFTMKEFSSYLEYLDFDVNDYDFGFNVDPFY